MWIAIFIGTVLVLALIFAGWAFKEAMVKTIDDDIAKRAMERFLNPDLDE